MRVQARLEARRKAKSAELRAQTVAKRKLPCAEHGMRKAGTKAELVALLCDAVQRTGWPPAKRLSAAGGALHGQHGGAGGQQTVRLWRPHVYTSSVGRSGLRAL
jgi:hypothetical protein